jgi:hypothetical protein
MPSGGGFYAIACLTSEAINVGTGTGSSPKLSGKLNCDCFWPARLAVEPTKRSSIVQHDTPRTGEFDGRVTFQI